MNHQHDGSSNDRSNGKRRIRERGIWSRHCSLARDGSCEFNVLGQDTLLGGAIERVKLDDGSYLNVLDDSDLADFIHHHAWFEGDEVALPREDRVYLLGNLTGQTPKKRRVTQSRSDLKVLNAGLFLSDRDRAA